MRPRIAIVVVASHRIGGGNVKFKVLCPSRRRSMAAAAAQKPCAAALCRSYPSSDSKRGLRAEQKPSATQSGLRKKVFEAPLPARRPLSFSQHKMDTTSDSVVYMYYLTRYFSIHYIYYIVAVACLSI